MFISELTTLEDAGVILAAQATALTPKDPQSIQTTHGPMKPAITIMDKSETGKSSILLQLIY